MTGMARLVVMIGLLLLSVSTVVTIALLPSSSAVVQTIVKALNGSNAHNTSSAEISYDTQNMSHRSAKEEWQPHRAQTTTSMEWWYITALLYDSSGNKYLLFTTLFKFDGKDLSAVKSEPQMAAMLGPSRIMSLISVALSNYNTGFHYYDSDRSIVNPKQMWNSETNTLNHSTPNFTGSWSFDGENMTAVLKSEKLSYHLNILGAQQVMWAKDRIYNKEGFIQEGLPGNVSFYYSLPRLMVSGKLSYMDESGTNRTIDVAGQGWVDRQWGDFKTNAWEWGSFRFDNGARANLYSFENEHKVMTYQKPDGSLQWFNNFTVRQNGYAKAPNGQWVSFGWSYDFPTNVEGSKHYTVIPFSKNDWICVSRSNCFFEGAGQLINDVTSKEVGTSVHESMDIQILKNGPYNVNQD